MARAVVRYAARLIGCEDAGQDAAQEAWLAVARGIGRLQDPARFRAWAFRILTNKCANHIEGLQRRRREVRAGDAVARARLTGEAGGGEDGADQVRRAIAEVDSGTRALLLLHYAQGLTVLEIGEVLGVPGGTVKSRLHQARRRVRERLESKASAAAAPQR